MNDFGLWTVFSFGPGGWGPAMAKATLMTLGVAVTGFFVGGFIGIFGAWAKISGSRPVRAVADTYTTVLRGIPDLLVIYLFYFGSSAVLTPLAHFFGASGFFSLPAFLAGSLAIGIVSGAYHTEVLRGGYSSVSRGEIEAASAVGMSRSLSFRRIIVPLTLRHALPGLGNIWQLVLKESSLISVTGLVEIMRQAQVGAGSTRQPFTFFLAAAIIYLVISSFTGWTMQKAEHHYTRGTRRA
jgi:octopine/nopaline transport system permease protein